MTATILQQKLIRRDTFRQIHIKQFNQLEADLTEAVAGVITKQTDDLKRNLQALIDDDHPLAPSMVLNDPIIYFEDLVNATFPILARSMGEAATSFHIAHHLERGFFSSIVESIAKIVVPAFQWLTGGGGDEVLPEGIDERWPANVIAEILIQMRESFEQPYWKDILETSSQDMERILEEGIKNGLSIREIAREINERFPENYSIARGRLIARTESAHSLNGGRHISYLKLKEEALSLGQFLNKEWVSVLADTTRDAHAELHGILADISDGMWDLNGVRIPWPGHIALPPSDRCNCMCTFVTTFGEN